MNAKISTLAAPALFVVLSAALRPEPSNPAVAHAARAPEVAAPGAPLPMPVPVKLKVPGALLEAPAAGSRAARVSAALGALGVQVREQSHPDALRYAVQAYYNFRAAHPEQVRKPYLYFVDYGLDSHTPRGYVFDMEAMKVVDGPFTVAHGRGSVSGDEGVPTRFSNREGSEATSLGLYLTQETYAFRGRSGGSSYRSIGLRLLGVSGRFNSTAFSRGVVVHGAPYVTPGRAGRSEGCPAMEPERAERLIPEIDDGALVYLFSPRDENWLREEPWAHGTPDTRAAAS